MAGSQKQEYILGGSTFSAARLDLQYFQFISALGGHHVDPSIDYQAPNLKIADVCCGTGLWLISLNPDPTTELHALDINTSALPPEQWLPTVKRHIYNINDPPPPNLVSSFDIVNVQQAWTFITDTDFDAVFANIQSLLKPGGYIQWTEHVPRSIEAISPDPSYQPQYLLRLYWDSFDILGMTLPTWPGGLDECVARNGVDVVKVVRPGIHYPMLKSWTRQQMTGWQEVLEMFWRRGPNGDEGKKRKVEALEESLKKAREEVDERGCAYFPPIVRVVGRKAGGEK